MRSRDSLDCSIQNSFTGQKSSRLYLSLAFKVLSVFLLLIHEGTGQIPRVSQFYPNAGTVTPYQFSFPVTNGFFLPAFTTYVQGETGGAAPSIRALRKDGSVIQVTANNALTSYSLNFYNDYMVSFGSMDSIIKYKFDYAFPGFFVLDAAQSLTHNLGFYMAKVDTSSGMHYISTLTAKIVYKYSDADLTTPAGQMTFPDVTVFSVLSFMTSNSIILAGKDSKIKFADRTSLVESLSYTTTCNAANAIINVLYDGVHVPQTEILLDAACDSLLTKYSFESGTLNKVAEITSFTNPISNLMEFPLHNYLMVTYIDTIEVVKRSSYLATDGFKQLTLATVNTYSYACCEENKHKFTFTAASGTGPIYFKSITINLDFCSNYDGLTCTECNSGYKLDSSDAGNRCITPDEYPPRYGAKGSLIAECKDSNCNQCIEAYYKCEACNPPFFINMESYECSDLANLSLFGKDLSNSSIIKRCKDSNCLFCKDDYSTCTLCQEEYFDLRNGACVAKEANLTVLKSWFNESESKGYFQFSGPFSVLPSKLFPDNITMKLLDNLNESYTDYNDLAFSGDQSSGLLVISINLQTSIYGGIMFFNQTAKSPVFYNPMSYMPQTAEFNITNVRQIRTANYFLIASLETPLKIVVWIIMIFSAIFGSIFHPLFGTLLMRTVSMVNLLSHLDGPSLHSSDLFLDIIGKVSLPLQIIDDALRTPEASLDCIPTDNFSKRYQGYSSCSIFDMYGKSILFFILGMAIGLPLSIAAYVKLKSLKELLMKDMKAVIDPGLSKFLVINRWFGVRLLSAIMFATSPVFLQYSYLSIVAGGAPVFATVFGCLVVVLYLIMMYADFRFTYLFLDFLHIQDLKKIQKHELTHEVSFHEEKPKSPKGLNMIMPKKDDMMPKITKDGRIKIPISLTDSKKAPEEPKNVPNLNDSSAMDSSTLLFLQDNSKRQVKIDLEILRNKYGFLHFFVQGFKNKANSGRALFFYLPLIELLCTFINCYVLVRFSGDGLVQVYIISMFELLSSFLFTLAKPYEERKLFILMIIYKTLIAMVLCLKMFNFIVMPEETARQKIVDTLMLFGSALLLLFAVLVALYSIYKSIVTVRNFKKFVTDEEIVLEELRLELKEKFGKDEPSVKAKEPSVESKSISGLSDSPARRDLPKQFLTIDKVARANKMTLKNKQKIEEDNLKLFQRETIKEDPAAEDRENIDDSEIKIPEKKREAPVVETVEITKKTEGIFTTVNVVNEMRKPAEVKIPQKPVVSVMEGQFLNPIFPPKQSIIEANPFPTRIPQGINVSFSKPKRQDKFASMLEDNKLDASSESSRLLLRNN